MFFSQNVCCAHENENAAFFNTSGLQSNFKNFSFRDGLVWTVGLTAKTKMHFENFSGMDRGGGGV